MSARAAVLPGVALAALELPEAPGATPDFAVWTVRAADLSDGSWARRVAAPRVRGPLYGYFDPKRTTLWVCVRQHNIGIAQSIVHEACHAIYPGATGTKRGETWSEVSERVCGLLLRAGLLKLTLRDRQLDAVRRQILGNTLAEPFEAGGRLEAAPGGPWSRGLGAAES